MSSINPYIKVELIKPYLANGWKEIYQELFEQAGIYKNAFGEVKFEGLIQGDWKTKIFTLPPGFRPLKRHLFVINASGGFQRLDVLPNGDVFLSKSGSNGIEGKGWISLDGVSFYSKQ